MDEPAPTIKGGHDHGDRQWIVDTGNTRSGTRERPAHTLTTTRRSDEGMLVGRQLPDGEGRNIGGHGWTADRPATTVAGDNRVPQPGNKKNADNPDSPGRMEGAVRVTEAEAAVLQGFPPDYPWQGNKGKRFEQIGNAVPPPLAAAVLRAVGAVRQEVAA